LFCMGEKDNKNKDKEIGCTGFYLYSYLSHKNDIFEKGYDVSIKNLTEETGIPKRTLIRYLGILKEYKMIDFIHNQDFFVIGMSEGERKATTYITRSYDLFSDKPIPFKRIEVKTEEEYSYYLKEKEGL